MVGGVRCLRRPACGRRLDASLNPGVRSVEDHKRRLGCGESRRVGGSQGSVGDRGGAAARPAAAVGSTTSARGESRGERSQCANCLLSSRPSGRNQPGGLDHAPHRCANASGISGGRDAIGADRFGIVALRDSRQRRADELLSRRGDARGVRLWRCGAQARPSVPNEAPYTGRRSSGWGFDHRPDSVHTVRPGCSVGAAGVPGRATAPSAAASPALRPARAGRRP
jgi:hypothetical protein